MTSISATELTGAEEASLLANDWSKERGSSRNEGVILSLAKALVASGRVSTDACRLEAAGTQEGPILEGPREGPDGPAENRISSLPFCILDYPKLNPTQYQGTSPPLESSVLYLTAWKSEVFHNIFTRFFVFACFDAGVHAPLSLTRHSLRDSLILCRQSGFLNRIPPITVVFVEQ